MVKVGNSSGRDIDKFAAFGLTPVAAERVKAPLIHECYANLECKVVDMRRCASDLNAVEVMLYEAHALFEQEADAEPAPVVMLVRRRAAPASSRCCASACRWACRWSPCATPGTSAASART